MQHGPESRQEHSVLHPNCHKSSLAPPTRFVRVEPTGCPKSFQNVRLQFPHSFFISIRSFLALRKGFKFKFVCFLFPETSLNFASIIFSFARPS